MRIVITGASGNVGTALLRRLAAAGSAHDLVGVVRRPPEPVGPYESVHWHSLDVAGADAARDARARRRRVVARRARRDAAEILSEAVAEEARELLAPRAAPRPYI